MKPTLSIVVPVYNGAPFVGKTIERLLQETVDKEIILINDGSKDNSLEVLMSYASKHDCIRVIDQANKGASATRNVGIAEAKGEYIYFNDCDDVVEEGSLSRAVGHFEDGVDVVLFSYKHVAADGSVITVIQYLPTGLYCIRDFAADSDRLLNSHIIACMGTTIRRTAILQENNIKFNENLSIYEDTIFAYTYMTYVRGVYYINEPLNSYTHVNPNGLYSRAQRDKIKVTDMMLNVVEMFYKKALETNDTTFFNAYIQSSFFSAIKNEAMHPFFSNEAARNLAYLSDSSYLERCNEVGSLLPHRYYEMLKSRSYIKLMLVAGFKPKMLRLAREIYVTFGRFVKYKVLRKKLHA